MGFCAYQARMLVPLFRERVTQHLDLSNREMVSVLRPYLSTAPSVSFLKRIRRMAVQRFMGDEEAVLQCMPTFLAGLVAAGHHAQLVTLGPVEMVESFVRTERDRHRKL